MTPTLYIFLSGMGDGGRLVRSLRSLGRRSDLALHEPDTTVEVDRLLSLHHFPTSTMDDLPTLSLYNLRA